VATSITRKWVIKGSKPKVKPEPCRKNVPYSGYVVPETGELIVSKSLSKNFIIGQNNKYYKIIKKTGDSKNA